MCLLVPVLAVPAAADDDHQMMATNTVRMVKVVMIGIMITAMATIIGMLGMPIMVIVVVVDDMVQAKQTMSTTSSTFVVGDFAAAPLSFPLGFSGASDTPWAP